MEPFAVTSSIPVERIQDLLVCGIEQNDWSKVVSVHHPEGDKTGLVPEGYEKGAPRWLMAVVREGWSITVEDTFEGGLHELNREKLQRGLTLLSTLTPTRHWADFCREDEDAETGDVFLQLCLFGEILYG